MFNVTTLDGLKVFCISLSFLTLTLSEYDDGEDDDDDDSWLLTGTGSKDACVFFRFQSLTIPAHIPCP